VKKTEEGRKEGRKEGRNSGERKEGNKDTKGIKERKISYVGFEVFTAVVVKSIIFWDTTPCSPLK
jgi:hypothetical protein